jgi:hypothetical protein
VLALQALQPLRFLPTEQLGFRLLGQLEEEGRVAAPERGFFARPLELL